MIEMFEFATSVNVPSIRIIIANAGHQSRKLAHQLPQRGQRAFNITGLTWILNRGTQLCMAGPQSPDK